MLLIAARRRHPVEPLTRWYPELTMADAAGIRDAALSHRVVSGDRLVGAKVSLPAVPALLATPEPRFGWVTESMLLSGQSVPLSAFIDPWVEPKLAFVVTRPPETGDVPAVTVRVSPCLEIVDSRYGPQAITPIDDVADNCSIGALLLGEGIRPRDAGSLHRMAVDLDAGGGRFTAAIGLPLEGLDRLAHEVTRYEDAAPHLKFLIGPPANIGMPLRGGARVRARFAGLGTLDLHVEAQ